MLHLFFFRMTERICLSLHFLRATVKLVNPWDVAREHQISSDVMDEFEPS